MAFLSQLTSRQFFTSNYHKFLTAPADWCCPIYERLASAPQLTACKNNWFKGHKACLFLLAGKLDFICVSRRQLRSFGGKPASLNKSRFYARTQVSGKADCIRATVLPTISAFQALEVHCGVVNVAAPVGTFCFVISFWSLATTDRNVWERTGVYRELSWPLP